MCLPLHEHGVPQVKEGRVRFAQHPWKALAPQGGCVRLTPREVERIEDFGRKHAEEVVRAAVATGSYRRIGQTAEGEDADAPPRRRYSLGSRPDASGWARSALLGSHDDLDVI